MGILDRNAHAYIYNQCMTSSINTTAVHDTIIHCHKSFVNNSLAQEKWSLE